MEIGLPAVINYAQPDDLTSGQGRGVAVSGGYAYVAAGTAGLNVIDMSSAAAPVRVGGYSPANWSAQGVAVLDDYAYLAAGSAGLTVLDVSNPAAPVRVGACTSGNARAAALSGGYGYVADWRNGLLIFRIESRADFDTDGDVDLADFGQFRSCFNGPNRPPACQ